MGMTPGNDLEGSDGGSGSSGTDLMHGSGKSLKPIFSLDRLELKYEPFPYGIAAPLFGADQYRELLDSFPGKEHFGVNPVNVKYVLSERINRRRYHAFLRSSPAWMEFYEWIKSDHFIQGVLDQLTRRHVDLGYRQRPRSARLGRRLRFGLSGRRDYRTSLTSRFEFSMLPADGGVVLPHTDSVNKVVTMVLPMVAEGEWDPRVGGNTDINRAKVDRLRYNAVNGKGDFDDMEIVDSLGFEPNRALVFVRTYNSWHSVRPMQAPGSNALRRTVTVNLLEA